jgi:DNA-binding NtrC family response regulator
MNNFRIAILDDEEAILNSLSNILLREGFEVFCFQNAQSLQKSMENNKFDVLFLDVFLGTGIESGLDILKKIKKVNSDLNVIMVSGNADIKTAVEAIKLGAKDFIEKPLHLEEVLSAIEKITSKITIKNERNQLLSDVLSRYEIIGNSKPMQLVKNQILQYSVLNEPVLIVGDSGTGKELVAANLHYNSTRRAKKYYKINIASLSENLIESELFGHKKGSFSGAVENKEGLFISANNSTLFLDEIGDLKFDVQSKLLRAIQEKEIIPVGENEPVKFNTRLIFATNKNLLEETKTKKFREDLYYRIATLKINIPPLRERKEDIKDISNVIIKNFCEENNISMKELSWQSLNKLNCYDFPGNIRELKNILVQSILITGNKNIIEDNSIFFDNTGNEQDKMCLSIFEDTKPLSEKKKELEKKYIETQLKKNEFNLQKTAVEQGLLINNLYRKIKELDIEIEK